MAKRSKIESFLRWEGSFPISWKATVWTGGFCVFDVDFFPHDALLNQPENRRAKLDEVHGVSANRSDRRELVISNFADFEKMAGGTQNLKFAFCHNIVFSTCCTNRNVGVGSYFFRPALKLTTGVKLNWGNFGAISRICGKSSHEVKNANGMWMIVLKKFKLFVGRNGVSTPKIKFGLIVDFCPVYFPSPISFSVMWVFGRNL